MIKRLKPLNPYLKRYWKSLAWGGVAVIIYNVVKVLVPVVIGHAIDDMRHSITQQRIMFHALRLLVVAVLCAIFLYITRQVIIGASREIEYDLRNDLFANLERQSPSFYHANRTGDIMARTTNDLNAVRQLLGPAIMYSANTLVFTCAALPFMYRISPKLTFFAFVPLPAASVLVQYFGNRIHRRFERIQAMFSDISAKAQENFSGARLIRAFAQEEAEIASFEEANREYIRRSLMLVRLMAMLWPTLEFVLGLSMVITLLVGGHEVVSHKITIGEFASFNVYMVQLIWPIIAVGWVVNLFQRGTASTIRINELLQQQPDITDDPSLLVCGPQLGQSVDAASTTAKMPPCKITGNIEFRNLSFSYSESAPVLHDINLTIPTGSSLALVGPTGSGKSTLISLIPRLLDAAPDTVLIDGRPIRSYPLSELRSHIGYVPQETFLFSDTIRHNISFGRPNASDLEIEEAAAVAHIRTEILEFPRGFDTLVGERGVTLSGGQKQRTSIARAVVRNPRILILDDALASVDTYTEERILSGLAGVMQGRTTIFISHRVSTARNADQIAVLVEGRIAELGTHDELIACNGYYTSLFEKQRLEEELSVAN
jgi:ATP-binding cassette subfamily B protein